MTTSGAIDLPLQVFGSYCPELPPASLPPGLSPYCQDVEFIRGGIKTRPGLVQQLTMGNNAINYIKSYITPAANKRTLTYDSIGNLYKDGVNIGQPGNQGATANYGKSTTCFGREWLAFSDGLNGNALPFQYDDTNLDRVSQEGPGLAPTVVDGAAGNISAGVHGVSVMFVTRQGYITRPSPPANWTAAGSKKATVTTIPIGPPNVVARILCFTAAGGANYFYTGAQSPITNGNMIIGDNTTTTATIDFTDAVLLAGTNVDENFNFVELGECAGVIDYAGRLFWWGERNKVQNFVNLSFDGGFNANLPLGWTAGAGNAGGGSNTANATWGFAYTITGDGATAVRGQIQQTAVTDWRGVPQLQQNTSYSVRVRANWTGVSFVQGTIRINFAHSGGAIVGGGFSLVASVLTPASTGTGQEYTGVIMSAQATIPSDLVLQVYIDGTPTLNAVAVIDCIEIFPTNTPFNSTTVRCSFNPAAPTGGPEAYDGVSGLIQPQPYDGQAIRCMFKQQEFLYIVKERSLYVTQDDGVNEPAQWSVKLVSNSVGTPSINGVAGGEDWNVIANRKGLYMFSGGEPIKISQEIQSNQTDIALLYFWDNVNWSVAQTLWVVVDEQNKRILVGLPFGIGITGVNGIFYLDYRPLGGSADIVASSPIHTSYSGRVINYEHSRKWAPWSIVASSAAVIELANGTGQVYFGSGQLNGNVYSLSETAFSDFTNTAINGFYVPYGFPSHDEEQGLQLGSHKKDFTYLTAYVEGAGLLTISFYPENPAVAAIAIAPWTLAVAPARDNERQLSGNITAERGFFLFSTNAVGSWFKMQKVVPSLKPSVIPLRGVS